MFQSIKHFKNHSEETYQQTEELKNSRKNIPIFFPKIIEVGPAKSSELLTKSKFFTYFFARISEK